MSLAIGIIPARMGSSRFPGKPLVDICGIPMIQHVYQRASMTEALASVHVATCDQVIADAVTGFGGRVVMTSKNHERCTDRVAEAVDKIGLSPDDMVVNIQGDEPLLHPNMIDAVLAPLMDNESLQTAHLVAEIMSDDEWKDPNEVKVVFDLQYNTLYCSREPIPSSKKGETGFRRWKQVCIISFRSSFLRTFNSLPQTPLEIVESVDMMRCVEHGYQVRCVVSPWQTVSVDTSRDLERCKILMEQDPVARTYLP